MALLLGASDRRWTWRSPIDRTAISVICSSFVANTSALSPGASRAALQRRNSWPGAAPRPTTTRSYCHHAVHGVVEIGIRENDVRRLAAHLERHPGAALRSLGRDGLARSVKVVNPWRAGCTVLPASVSASPAKNLQSSATAAIPGRISEMSLPFSRTCWVTKGFRFALDQLGESKQTPCTLPRQKARPATILERASRSAHRRIHVRGAGFGDAAPVGFQVGIVCRSIRPTLRATPFAVDGVSSSVRMRLQDGLGTHRARSPLRSLGMPGADHGTECARPTSTSSFAGAPVKDAALVCDRALLERCFAAGELQRLRARLDILERSVFGPRPGYARSRARRSGRCRARHRSVDGLRLRARRAARGKLPAVAGNLPCRARGLQRSQNR